MAVTGTPVVAAVSTDVVSADEMRDFLRDKAPNNPLLDDVEFSDTEMTTAVARAVDHANAIDRPMEWTVTSFPNKYVLLLGAGAYLMQSESFRQVRNEAQYQDGNVQPIGIDNKQSLYMGIAQSLKAEFMQLVRSIKIQDNMSKSSSLSSPSRNTRALY